MCGAVVFAIFAILGKIPGGLATVDSMLDGRNVAMFQTGWEATKPFGDALKAMLENPYTILAALLGSTFLTMATHGTDQDMVQRMLTAENIRKSRFSLILSGFADIPIVLAFLAVGIRGLIVAGVFATMMGSTSAALNALATSFIRDFYQPSFTKHSTDSESIRTARTATAVFGGLMILVATAAAYAVLETNITIIPLALGVLGYGYGSLLGIFLLGVLTKKRGNDATNVIAMILGIAAVLILGKVKIPAIDPAALLRFELIPAEWNFGLLMPEWWPAIAWPYYVFIGSTVTLSLGILFKSKRTLEQA
ncbi:MAG: sodium:solute symporter family transporter, partial [Spartobacteria bacterium]